MKRKVKPKNVFDYLFRFIELVLTILAICLAVNANKISTKTYKDSVDREEKNQIESNKLNKKYLELIDSIKNEASKQLIVGQNQINLTNDLIQLNINQSRPLMAIRETLILNEGKHNTDEAKYGVKLSTKMCNFGGRPTTCKYIDFILGQDLEIHASSQSVEKIFYPNDEIPVNKAHYFESAIKDDFYYCIKLFYDDPILQKKYCIYNMVHVFYINDGKSCIVIRDSPESKTVATAISKFMKRNCPELGVFKDIEEEEN